LISSRALAEAQADIMDIAPTVLKYFAVPIPGDIDGKSIF
jgi:predicted AlkP superfamily phosphohydrolase/phosphomutase